MHCLFKIGVMLTSVSETLIKKQSKKKKTVSKKVIFIPLRH
jgi:hypothetical protein